MNDTLVLYHASCADGFCAAWLYHKYVDKNLEAEYKAVQYGDKYLPDVIGRDVVMLDFSYKRTEMEQMAREASSFLCLDHHKTAEVELEGLNYCIFDMNKSGARMTYEHLCVSPHSSIRKPPWIVAYVEDRDLWKWELPDSREVSAALAYYDRKFEEWNKILAAGPDNAIKIGRVLLSQQTKQVTAATGDYRIGYSNIGGHVVPVVNATLNISEIGNELAKRHPDLFAASFFYKPDGQVVYSLRSLDPTGMDVSEIAKKYGGGGHMHSAGFSSNVLLPMKKDPRDVR